MSEWIMRLYKRFGIPQLPVSLGFCEFLEMLGFHQLLVFLEFLGFGGFLESFLMVTDD
jgi:hypothetical protein